MKNSLSRRSFIAMAAAASASLAVPAMAKKKIPLGLELYSVRGDMTKDVMGSVRSVAKMGYEVVEFYGPYYQWKPEYAKDVRKLLDELKIRCLSTHNGAQSFTKEGIDKAIELNSILGSKYVVMASPPRIQGGIDGWKTVADMLNFAAGKFKPAKLKAGYHNHGQEFKPIDNVRPIEVIARNTSKDVLLQLDVGTCVEMGQDPVAWINANPGRIRSVHCKEWSSTPGKGYKALFGEGSAPWPKVFEAAEKKGGVEFYLIEQEQSEGLSEMEAAARCYTNFRKIHK